MAAGVKANRLVKSVPAKQAPARVIHLYGLTEASGPSSEAFRDLKGVDGIAAIESIACGGLACWISRVSEAEFAENLAKNMQDLDWLANVTTRHQQIISAIAETGDILPARFGIEFLNDESLRSHIMGRQSVLKADLERIRGKEEWGVKVFGLPIMAAAPKKKIRTGKEYLQAKSALTRRVTDRANPELQEFAKALQSIADNIAEGGKFASASRDLQFHKTVLLKRADRKRLERLVRSYSKKWKNRKRIECTGPWPPFSFVSGPESGRSDG
jgi:Gas vesicle synthesis protein GvpL/GvpF